MCYRKKTILNPVKDNNRSGFDKYKIKVQCNSCPACRKVRQNDWIVRSYFEFLKNRRQAFFVSVTFDNDHLPIWDCSYKKLRTWKYVDTFRKNHVSYPSHRFLPCFDTECVKTFLNRIRGHIGKFRYFYASDFGGLLHRAHYHFVIIPENKFTESDLFRIVCHAWTFGEQKDLELMDCVMHNPVKAIQYITKYTTKDVVVENIWQFRYLPRRHRPDTHSSKGFGMQAFDEGYVSKDILLKDKTIDLPLGKGKDKLRRFVIPRYYEMVLSYDRHYDPVTRKTTLIKNEFGVALDKSRHNRRYVYQIKQFFASRHLDIHNVLGTQYKLFGLKWYDAVSECFTNFDDFKEFMYCRPFIRNYHVYIPDGSHEILVRDYGPITCDFGPHDNPSCEYVELNNGFPYLYRPDWAFYNRVVSTYELFQSQVDSASDKEASLKLINAARYSAVSRIISSPRLQRYYRARKIDIIDIINNRSNRLLKQFNYG